ncbi:MAG: hypothetical protein M3P53_04905 [Actinomycetota bacterium]|nr:hypothetical protein [Actinomycetota bacterium]
MTAGVIVMNASAVALAADSTVTIPYRDGAKHFRGASKLLALHSRAPVAVFWYGSPDYLGVPWEVLIKDFRSHSTDLRSSVAKYQTALFEYVDEAAVGWELASTDHARVLVQPLLSRVVKALQVPVAKRDEVVAQVIADWRESLRPRRRVLEDGFVEGYAPLWEWLEGQLNELADDGALQAVSRQALRTAALSAWTHLSAREPEHTGLVVAGYGEAERLPVICPYLLGVPVGGRPRRAEMRPVAVSAETPAIIVPFAANTHARLFMEGIDPNLKKWFMGALKELDLPKPVVERLIRLLEQQINDHGRPVTEAVRFLPKADLAELARQIVGFTAFRLRMSMSVETVGEPIDVAVVSRSEGVVWVHRTHYFPPALNPRYSLGG